MLSILQNNKKGALELSMNAIVIIVLAFAMLGLGLVFTRTLLSQATEGAGSVTGSAQEQILESLRSGDKKISIQRDIKLQKKASTTFGIGIKNTGDTGMTYSVDILTAAGTPVNSTDGFIFSTASRTLAAGDSEIVPVKYTGGATGSTALYTVRVNDSATTTYATSDFFITVQ